MRMQIWIVFYLYCLILIFFPLASSLADEVVTLGTRSGVTQSFLLLEPKGDPKGIILMFPGHWGVVKFKKTDGGITVTTEGGGFTANIDTRTTYQKNGMVVALLAPPSDMQGGMDTVFRSSDKYLVDISAVIAYLNKRYQKAPYLHGHCASSLSSTSIATKLNNKGISGLILSSPRSRGRLGAVTDYTKGVINVPVLLIQHANDPCKGTPYRKLDKVKRFYESSSQKVDVIIVSGGDTTQAGPKSCQNRAHSFHGLQMETASSIANWIQGKDFQVQISD
jgi:hypothetical protein